MSMMDDLFQHFRDRLASLVLDHIDTCRRIGMSNHEIAESIIAAMIHEMLIVMRASGGDEDILETSIIANCRAHFAEIMRQDEPAP